MLSPRQMEVARLLAEGQFTLKQIAAQMFISDGTVRLHAAAIRKRLGLKTNAAVAVWYSMNYLTPLCDRACPLKTTLDNIRKLVSDYPQITIDQRSSEAK